MVQKQKKYYLEIAINVQDRAASVKVFYFVGSINTPCSERSIALLARNFKQYKHPIDQKVGNRNNEKRHFFEFSKELNISRAAMHVNTKRSLINKVR